MEFRIHKKENVYFAIKLIFTVLVVWGVVAGLSDLGKLGAAMAASTVGVVIFYALFIWAFVVFQKIILMGHLKGNGVEISGSQFPEMHAKYRAMGEALGLKKLPRLFLVQHGGMLNAFAIRFSGKNYVAVYSEVFSLFEEDEDVVRFVLAHELGHVKRAHLVKRFWTFPSAVIPFLEAAYSRACEYTCDNIGDALAPGKSVAALVLLAAGRDVYKRVNPESYVRNAEENNTAVVKFAGLFMSHPYLPRRIKNLKAGK